MSFPHRLILQLCACLLVVSTSVGEVLNGVDVLVRDGFPPFHSKRVGLITNHTGHDRDRSSTIDLLHGHPTVSLTALFSPEHGIRGDKDEKIGDGVDEKTGLPVYSLYGKTRKPLREQLLNVDLLVFDIQDIGCRFYTYVGTMKECMEAAAESGIPFYVLDRVNPITGTRVDGPVLEGKMDFVGWHDVTVRHGMTVGELAMMFREEKGIPVDLHVIKVEGWKRDMWFDETGLPWTNPSPNMRSLEEAVLYPGVGLIEFTNVSVGRGTDTPFELVGAPYVEDVPFARALNELGLEGVRFVPTRFTPDASKFEGETCGGVNILIIDREKADVESIGLALAGTLHRMYPDDYKIDRFQRLLFHPDTFEAVKAGRPISDIRKTWKKAQREYLKRRKKYLLYE